MPNAMLLLPQKILEENGYIYKGKHEGWYSVSDEAFYTSGQVQEALDEKTGSKIMVSTETGQPVEWTVEENYKFKLSACQDNLKQWLSANPSKSTIFEMLYCTLLIPFNSCCCASESYERSAIMD